MRKSIVVKDQRCKLFFREKLRGFFSFVEGPIVVGVVMVFCSWFMAQKGAKNGLGKVRKRSAIILPESITKIQL